jgi:hypothetical protein
MSTYDDYLNVAAKECKEAITEAQEKAKAVLEPIVDQLQKESLPNIPKVFGEFLYTSLGDKITGSRNSILNQTLLNESMYGKAAVERANTNGITVEEQLRKDQAYDHHNYSYKYHQVQAWITTATKFGVSYVAGEGNRLSTIYFSSDHCFKYLTQEHVDLIRNRLKRECAQAFLDFRNDFVTGAEQLGMETIEVDIPVTLGQVACVVKSPKINGNVHSYRDRTKKFYQVMDGTVYDKITHVVATIEKYEKWDKAAEVNKNVKKVGYTSHPTYISLTFFNCDREKTVSVIGNVDIAMDEVRTSVETMNDNNVRQVLNGLSCLPSNRTKWLTAAGSIVDAQGILMNMDAVLQNPTVKDAIDKRLKFYNDMSARLQELKHDHATLYFLNADI